MKYYVEAYDGKRLPILGNLDGQAVLHVKNPLRTAYVKRLFDRDIPWADGTLRPRWERVKSWAIISEDGTVHHTIDNPSYKEQTPCIRLNQ